MQHQGLVANPFALMMDPEAVFQAIECSDRMNRLQRRVCRPLDKPLIPKIGDDADAFDQSVDAEPDLPTAEDLSA